MKTLIRIAILTGLLATATAGCQGSYVLVTVEVPARLNANSIRVVRAAAEGRSEWMQDDRLPLDVTEGGFVIYNVGVPTEAIGLTLVVQAMSEQEVLAESRLQVTAAVGQTLRLQPCANALARGTEFRSCQPASPSTSSAPGDAEIDMAPTGVVDAGPDQDLAPPMPDTAMADAVSRACIVADPAAAQAPLPTVSMVSPACQKYCAAMQQNCPAVFRTEARCRYACDLLGWPAEGDPMQDTVACRTSFAEEPTRDPANSPKYCVAASPVVTNACGDLCAMFCRSGARICPGSFPDEATCRSGCDAERERFRQKLRDTPDANVSNDFYSKLWCRNERLEAAIFNRTYCDVAAPNRMCGACAELNFVP